MLVNRAGLRRSAAVLLALGIVATGCSSNPLTAPPPTIDPATPAASPPAGTRPAGELLPLGGRPEAAIFDERTGSLAVLAPGLDPQSPSMLTLFAVSGGTRELTLPGPATALAGDGQGSAYLSARGGYFTVDLAAGAATTVSITDETDTDFTAIARRADGRLVLGSADGTAYTLGSETAVAEKVKIFARVDAIAADGNNAVVLDRGQTSVTSLDSDGHTQQALRAGEGATNVVSDPLGRVLVTDTRGGQLLVFGVDPLIERQAYPVPQAPYGLAGSRNLTWVSQTAANLVVGYDLTTGIPVEKVRYPTVQQPNSLAFDDTSDTLYVVSATGAGVQVIRNAAGAR
ncbi:YncE family protein [Mycolicibacterium sp. Dal123E01]|uniref:YncE family protein n=1 Tax=Mycolicibacterium sp. Dal123E01 TaxID=3457578 RepID=UPI00403EB5C7